METSDSLPVRVEQALKQHLSKHLKGEFIPLERSPSAGPSEVARINGSEVTAATIDIKNALITSLADAGVELRQIFEKGTNIWSLTMVLEDPKELGQILATYKKESHELIVSVLSGISTSDE